MNKTVRHCFVTSLMLHAALLFSFPSCNGGESEKKHFGSTVNIEIIPKFPNAKEKIKCEQWYGGIGIEHSEDGSTIMKVVEGYPAYRAGILVGDAVIVPFNSYDIKGMPGTPVQVTVVRMGKVLEFHMIREKICQGS